MKKTAAAFASVLMFTTGVVVLGASFGLVEADLQPALKTPTKQACPQSYYATGDSIAESLNKIGIPGNGKQSAQPNAIMGFIQQSGNLNGKTVILSSGASNCASKTKNTCNEALFRQQIQRLRAQGAGCVILLGVGSDYAAHGLNKKLQDIAAAEGAIFCPLPPTSDGVHPSPAALKTAVAGANCSGAGIGPPGKIPPASVSDTKTPPGSPTSIASAYGSPGAPPPSAGSPQGGMPLSPATLSSLMQQFTPPQNSGQPQPFTPPAFAGGAELSSLLSGLAKHASTTVVAEALKKGLALFDSAGIVESSVSIKVANSSKRGEENATSDTPAPKETNTFPSSGNSPAIGQAAETGGLQALLGRIRAALSSLLAF